MIDDLVGIPLPWTEGSGFALERRQRDELPLPQPLLREQPGAVASPSTTRSSASTRASRGSTRSRPTARATPTTRCRARSRTSPTSWRRVQRRSQPGFATLGLPVLDGSRSDVRLGVERRGGRRPGTFPPDEVPTLIRPDYVHNGNDSHWLSNPEAPLTGFDRIIGIENAERTHADAARADPGRGPARRHRRPARQPVQPQSCSSGSRSATASTSASCGATRCVSLCDERARRVPARLERARWTSAARASRSRTGTCATTSDSNGAILFRRFASQTCSTTSTRCPPACRAGRRPGSETIFTTPYSNCRPGAHAERPQHRATRSCSARSPTPSPTSRAPASRSTRRCAASSTRLAAASDDPDPRRPRRRSASSTRSTSRWDPEKDGYGDVEHGSSFIMAAQFVDGEVPGRARARSSPTARARTSARARRRLHAGVLAEALEPSAVLRAEVRRKALSTQRIAIGRR